VSCFAVLVCVVAFGPCVDAVAGAEGDQEEEGFGGETAVAIEEVGAEHVWGSSGLEGREGVLSDTLLCYASFVSPPETVDFRSRHVTEPGN